MKLLTEKKYWIFDMDGTLTVAQHDFLAIKQELGISLELDILTSLSKLPEEIKLQKQIQLDEIEYKIAKLAIAMQGSTNLLTQLKVMGHQIGILTRNSFDNAIETLKAARIDSFFEKEHIICRNKALPKPMPDGILHLMREWNAKLDATIMVGDYLYDMLAGKNAGVQTIYIDPSGNFPYQDEANYSVKNLDEILYL
ncbi:HAD family hydrolase [Leptospira jelokensis]|uniref:HAD family hydrolase n=1 Tax=Leptospira jelokensis TaxID=2484931 RepID=A0A4Z1ACD0_9LEPT|nr:HAD-IA family hydrolase [Leptospira jelokensis]TGL75966.1 HAD family hydrolase [Leptospira jelokensis]